MSRVEPNRNVYVGHRYVPKIFGEWDKQNEYEGLSIVTHQGASYTSKKRVPVGIDIKNEEFWVVTGNYDAQVENYRDEVKRMEERVNESLEVTVKKNELMVNVMDHGAKGDGLTVDSDAIDNAIDFALEHKRNLYFPAGRYLINRTIYTKGVSIYGDKGNIFTDDQGSIIVCSDKGFTAISQGKTTSREIQFEYKYLIVENANIGFEINYVINSEFNNLYAKSCNIGYKLGDLSSVGSMFNEFNNLYTNKCEVGIISESNNYFNNNVFNNGFIQGNDYAARFYVTGGYGAVNNTFNNVEFRSQTGRGVILERCANTVFNQCYLEVGANAVRVGSASSVVLNDCIYGLFKSDNKENDTSVLYFETGATRSSVTGGRIYLSGEYSDKHFIDSQYGFSTERLTIYSDPSLVNTSMTSTFNLYNRVYNHMIDNNVMSKFVDLKLNDKVLTHGDLTVIDDFEVLQNTEEIKGGKIKLSKGHWLINARVTLNMEDTAVSKYFYVRKNGVNFLSEVHSLESTEKDLRRFSINKVIKVNEGDEIDFTVLYSGAVNEVSINGGFQSFIDLKYLG